MKMGPEPRSLKAASRSKGPLPGASNVGTFEERPWTARASPGRGPSSEATPAQEHGSQRPHSHLQQHAARIFQAILHRDEELHSLTPINDPMVVGDSQIHHRPNLDLAVNDHGPLLDLVHTQDRAL